MDCKYDVAIRTIGRAGEKYVQEIKSLYQQTILPHRVVVYIAEGFDLPQRVGQEEYIYVHKGLVHQRAVVPDDEVDFLLILDDDVYLPEDTVERMCEQMNKTQADCIIPDTFPTQSLKTKDKLIAYFSNNVSPRKNDGYAVKMKKSGAFSYNNRPPKGALLETQGGAGPAFFVKKPSFMSIRYSDEVWVDDFPAGTFYEDQLMFYKLYKNGCKMMMWYDSGVKHLDAGTNNQKEKSYEKLMYRAMANYVIWHRTILGTTTGLFERGFCHISYFYRFFFGMFTRIVFALMNGSSKFVKAYWCGNMRGVQYVRTNQYKNLPPYIVC
ncbi:MAG: glycosyltransferase family 2 protein [Bacteroidaceae bacterium]|nr:glycosyltransferase family 2 protein [Bacteroidaceae bacterium]